MPRPATRPVTGILLLDKPRGPSSNRALQQVRRLYQAAKAGHSGSLDPLASGLLPICLGEATKIAGVLLGSSKAYEVACRLGATTTTDDSEGDVLLERPSPQLSAADIEPALARLTGRIVQVPPVYSAIKRDGVPLYRRARRGEAVAPPPREVEIRRFDLLDIDGATLRLHVECGSGTYVRSLVRDLGEHFGCGAHVTALRRLWVLPFRTPAMTTLAELASLAEEGLDALDQRLLPLEQGLAGYPAITLDADAAMRIVQGQVIEVEGAASGRCVALDRDGRALALAQCDGHRLRPLRGFRRPPQPS
jgi:tRNA pseudouridine55 synthase